MEKQLFNSAYGLKMTLPQVVAEIVRFMRAEPQWKYKVMIGSDSERLADGRADFVSAVVVHRVGNGGRYFWRGAQLGKFHTLRDRIIREVLLSLELGKQTLLELEKLTLQANDAPAWNFEIHLDVGENGETKTMIQEVVGMVRAHNFEAITKPGSYAASNVADRHV